MKKFFLLFLFIILSFNFCFGDLEIKGKKIPGSALFISKEGREEEEAKFEFNHKIYNLIFNKNIFQTLVPLPLELKPGKYTLSLIYQDKKTNYLILIAKAPYMTQYLSLPKTQTAKYDYPGVEKEYRLIDKAFAEFSIERFWEGNFIFPCKRNITTSFGLRRFINGEEAGFHRGIDLAADYGEPVYASNSGIVSLKEENFTLHGKTLIINHGQGVSSIYLHLSKIKVKLGQMVKKGEIIAYAGATGVATGPHLHFGMYVQGIAVNPNIFLKLPDGFK
ncbi:MAG: M23 family metallopeptidase [Armatimonadetes bacterium]|nr:M23 family metallopeptidase [Armatimonadota bacterium]